MGFFGWGRKKRGAGNGVVVPGDPRINHYLFAHRVLRDVAGEDAVKFAAMMVSREAPELLFDLWGVVTRECAGEENCEATAGEFSVQPVRMGDWPCALIKLPRAERVTEAIMVALVMEIHLDEPPPPEGTEGIKVHCYTLELGMDHEGRARTVFGQWDGETHHNFGDGPEPDIGAFLQTVSRKMGAPLM